jgi:hypothetical protein
MPTAGRRRTRVRDGVYLLAAATGLVGTAFHNWNVGRKPGGFTWQNLFYAAPLDARVALSLSGAMGEAGLRDPFCTLAQS